MSSNFVSPTFVQITMNPYDLREPLGPAINVNDIHSIGKSINGHCLISYHDKLNKKLQCAYISQDAAGKLNIIG